MTDSLREARLKVTGILAESHGEAAAAVLSCMIHDIYQAVVQPMFDGLNAQMDMVKRQSNEKLDNHIVDLNKKVEEHRACLAYCREQLIAAGYDDAAPLEAQVRSVIKREKRLEQERNVAQCNLNEAMKSLAKIDTDTKGA